jgi:hypothetical protein
MFLTFIRKVMTLSSEAEGSKGDSMFLRNVIASYPKKKAWILFVAPYTRRVSGSSTRYVFRALLTCIQFTENTNEYTVDPRVTTGLTSDQLGLRPTFFFFFTYDQISSDDPRQRQRGEHISDITCSSLRALAVFALFCMRGHANSSYQSMYSIIKYRVTEKGCVSLTARSSINQA